MILIQRQYWKYILYILMALYVVFISTSMSYLNGMISEGQEYGVSTVREVREIRTRINEMENILPGLYSSPEMSMADVLEEMKRKEDLLNTTMGNLRRNYIDDSGHIAKLHQELDKLAEIKRVGARKMEHNQSYELANSYFREEIRPQIAAVDDILDEISLGIDRHSAFIHSRIHTSMNLIIYISLVFGAFMVIMTMLYDRRVESADKDLAYRDELFRQLARNIDEVFVIAVNGNDFEYVGDNSKRLLNLSAKDLYAHPERLGSFLPEADAEWLTGVLNGPHLAEPVERDVRAPGLDKFLKVRVYSIYVPSTGKERFIVVVSDQTEITRHQQALSDALESAHSASAAKSSFLSHMSHEIRTPMNAIIGMTTIALSRIQDQTRVLDCLGKIAESSRHLLGLINDVLDMSKIESGKLSICHEKFNLHQAIENISNIVRPQVQARKQNFEIFLENVDEENLVGDAMRLNQILLNILSNAFKFTPEGGAITLTLRQLEKKGDSVRFRITIKDTGIGMSPEFLKRLYSPFEQASANTASKYGGTGLGMPITANLVSMMGGTINVKSTEGKGTTFFIELPFGLSGEACYKQNSLPHLRVLVVDDDPGTCEHAGLLLEKMGLAQDSALTGREAVEMARKAHEEGRGYDVCLIDWRMPDMNGAATARAIRQVVGSDMLIIIISAYDLEPIEAEARAEGINNFIAKPLFASTLFDALAHATRKLNASAGPEDHEPHTKYDFGGKRVLLVEDNEFNREIGEEFLRMVNVEVDNAENGREAVEKFTHSAENRYDLILMDVQMPVMDGYEATRLIRVSSHPRAATIPILAMTANAFSEDVAMATAAGMNSHLAKPIDINALYSLLAEYLQTREPGAA